LVFGCGVVPFLLSVCGGADTRSSDSFYVRNDPNNDAVIIFVHGVTGDSRSTWTSDRTHLFWPRMLTQDPAFDGTNVFVYGYDFSRLGLSITIGELGENLRDMLSSNKIFKHRNGKGAP